VVGDTFDQTRSADLDGATIATRLSDLVVATRVVWESTAKCETAELVEERVRLEAELHRLRPRLETAARSQELARAMAAFVVALQALPLTWGRIVDQLATQKR